MDKAMEAAREREAALAKCREVLVALASQRPKYGPLATHAQTALNQLAHSDVLTAAIPHLGAQREEIARLREALEPFAKAAEIAENDEADDYSLYGSSARHELNLGHLRNAKAVLSLPSPPADSEGKL